MAITRYYCTHCSHAFEAEEKENIECPSCVWTSSVFREAEHLENEAQLQQVRSPQKRLAMPRGFRIVVDALKPLLILLFVLGVCAAGFVFFKPQVMSFAPKIQSWVGKSPKLSPATKDNFSEAKKTLHKTNLSIVPATAEALKAPALSEQEKAVLARRIELDPARELSAMEKELLGRAAALKTGRVEKLPGPAWTLELFKKMLDDQQAIYQVPLPRSYRNKLQVLFETKYLMGAQAFSEGRLLDARNLWVESLGFPIYANDIEKHRGVALTMLRSFINDTLSKIGALNAMLVEGPVRDRETKLNGAYGQFQKLIADQQWDAAFEAAEGLLTMTADFEKIAVQRPQVPPYPPAAQIDRDIGKSLYDLLEASRPLIADVGSLERDVRMKKQVIETLLPGRFSDAIGFYREGLTAMDQTEWRRAVDLFAKVRQPAVLQRDSAEKTKILEKIDRAELDSAKNSG